MPQLGKGTDRGLRRFYQTIIDGNSDEERIRPTDRPKAKMSSGLDSGRQRDEKYLICLSSPYILLTVRCPSTTGVRRGF